MTSVTKAMWTTLGATALTLIPTAASAQSTQPGFQLSLGGASTQPATEPAAQSPSEGFPENGLYLGIYGGGTLKLNDWDLGVAPRTKTVQPKSAPMAGARLGYHILPQLIGEIGGAWLPITSTAGESNTGFKYDFDLYYHLMSGSVSPFVGLGTGAYLLVDDGDLGGDNDLQFHGSLGLRGMVSQNIALRAEVRDYFVDSYSDFGGNNLELSAGLDIYFNAGEPPKPPPPDRDRDGVIDSLDQCIDIPGPVTLQGCPDTDADGLVDPKDECPTEAGPAERKGCPVRDQDKDTVEDANDKCPTVAGEVALEGCPDTDKDGIADADDRCPQEAGPVEFKGCPDKDGDKVPNIDDKCPDVTGLPEHQGCLPEAVQKFTGAIDGITFELGSAKIRPKSFVVLDKAVAVIKEYKSLKLRIEGHTDNIGKADRNLQLSKDRAASVKQYFVSKGIEENRIQTEGFGMDKPVADNKTEPGRAKNRRIEFVVLGQ